MPMKTLHAAIARALFASLRVAALCVASICVASPASAQSALADAESAYQDIDFERTRERANAALREGGKSKRQLVRIYELLGISAAASGDAQASRDAYVRMLAIDPEAQVDSDLSPRFREPFMEARGYWSSRSDQLDVEVRFDRARGALRVLLSDPVGMANQTKLMSRLPGTIEFAEATRPANDSVRFDVSGAADAGAIEYVLRVEDEYGNTIIERGTEEEPNRVGQLSGAVSSGSGGNNGGGEEDGGGSVLKSPWFWVVTGVVLAGAGVGAYFLTQDASTDLSITTTIGQ